jgi:hypothetical protein
MDEPDTAPEAKEMTAAEQKAEADLRRLAMRISVGYFLRFLEILSDSSEGNLLRIIMFMTILKANVTPLDVDPEISRQFAALETIPPDEIRRPISVSALAASLAMPYETARRQVNTMIDLGLCERVGDEGLIVPSRVLEEPRMLQSIERNYVNLKSLVRNLKRAGVDLD